MLRCNVHASYNARFQSLVPPVPGWSERKKARTRRADSKGCAVLTQWKEETLPQCAPAAASAPAPPRAGRDSQITGTSSRNISAEA